MDTTTQPDATERMYARVRALLAKAERTDNPHEAEAFSAKAFELIDAHRLDMAKVRDTEPQFTGTRFPLHQFSYLRASFYLLATIGRHYGVVVVAGASGNTKNPLVFGDPDDVLAMVTMFTSLVLQRDRACLAQPTPAGHKTVSFRNSFCYGYAAGIAKRLEELREVAVNAAASDSTALVLYGRHDAVKEWLGGAIQSANMNRPKVSRAGLDRGGEEAANADLGQRRMAAGPREIGAGR